ncbi:MAG: HD domain-containing protein [Erysipelotrichia bacterium]|nr:HD domain-containing protein [Erysipelotrichia bacterium]NCC54557.1 HD domain-containing protein [Erysipelotrichia bacterium]
MVVHLQKTNEPKVLRDVVHGYIHVDLQVIWDLINAKEFQRLRRINQLGGVFQVYHTAEHSRFAHSLGVYEIVRRMVYEIKGLNEGLSEYEKASVMIAGLLHDVGHLPFSHAAESICTIPHEQFSTMIILEDTQIHQILDKVDIHLAKDVADIIAYRHPKHLLNQIVSGQLDADRMDYLLRDAYMSGTSYGKFDLERILRTIRVKDERIVVKESGIHSVEDYIMARYHMYWQVYFHPVARSFEALFSLLFKRMRYLYAQKPSLFTSLQMFVPFLQEKISVYDHFMLDEHAAYYGFGLLTHFEDTIISDLARRILDCDLFAYETINSDDEYEKIKERIVRKGYDPKYYAILDTTSKSPYRPYGSSDSHNIYVLRKDGEVCELSQSSVIVKSLVHGDIKEEKKVFFPKEREVN